MAKQLIRDLLTAVILLGFVILDITAALLAARPWLWLSVADFTIAIVTLAVAVTCWRRAVKLADHIDETLKLYNSLHKRLENDNIHV